MGPFSKKIKNEINLFFKKKDHIWTNFFMLDFVINMCDYFELSNNSIGWVVPKSQNVNRIKTLVTTETHFGWYKDIYCIFQKIKFLKTSQFHFNAALNELDRKYFEITQIYHFPPSSEKTT